MKKADRKAELLKKLQKELDRRTQVEKEAVKLISNGECEKACELLNTLDDNVVKDIEQELDRLNTDVEGECKEKTMSAEIIEVVRTETREGVGTEKDPVRIVIRYWEKNGELIAEKEKDMLSD